VVENLLKTGKRKHRYVTITNTQYDKIKAEIPFNLFEDHRELMFDSYYNDTEILISLTAKKYDSILKDVAITSVSPISN